MKASAAARQEEQARAPVPYSVPKFRPASSAGRSVSSTLRLSSASFLRWWRPILWLRPAAVDQGRAGEARASLLLLEGLDRSLLEWHLLTRNPDAADFEALSASFCATRWQRKACCNARLSKLPQELPEDELLRWFGAFPPITAQAALAYVRILEGRGELERLPRLRGEAGATSARRCR